MKTTWIAALALSLFLFPFDTAAQPNPAFNFKARLSGDEEVPPVVTDAQGHFLLHVDNQLTEMRFKLTVKRGENLLGVAGAHLHCAPEGVNGPVFAFLAGMAPPAGFDGRIDVRATLDDDSFIGETPCGTTVADVVEAILDGLVYVNVHTVQNPGGEVRGQLH